MLKEKPPKVRNSGTMTESAFWGFIRSSLRQKSRWWKPVAEARMKARRKYHGPNKRQKWEYQCNKCKGWFMGDEIAVDHIIPCGTLKTANDLPKFVETLFCEVYNLQVMCSPCHDVKTADDKQLKTKET